jgi:hypothetical protein
MNIPPDLNHRVLELESALRTLIKSAKPCKHCHPENECYTFSMTALADAGNVLNRS